MGKTTHSPVEISLPWLLCPVYLHGTDGRHSGGTCSSSLKPFHGQLVLILAHHTISEHGSYFYSSSILRPNRFHWILPRIHRPQHTISASQSYLAIALRQLTPSPISRLLTSLVRSCKCLRPRRTRFRRRRHHPHRRRRISANSSGYYNARRAHCHCGSPSPSPAARPYARPAYQRPMSGPTCRTQPAKTGGGDCDVPSPAAARSMLWAIAASTLL